MIVVDTNVLAYLYFPGVRNKIIEELQLKSPTWIAPILWKSEFRNVASLYYRKGLVTFEGVIEALDKAEELMSGYEEEVSSKDVFAMVRSSKCSSYDCEFIAMANNLRLPLITYDKLILQEYPDIALTPEVYLQSFK
ncbi:MAG TPA: type II toxin-antitoxin system VapC family toxin [Cyclobacteriaceae bacterium]